MLHFKNCFVHLIRANLIDIYEDDKIITPYKIKHTFPCIARILGEDERNNNAEFWFDDFDSPNWFLKVTMKTVSRPDISVENAGEPEAGDSCLTADSQRSFVIPYERNLFSRIIDLIRAHSDVGITTKVSDAII
ncbi:hypothetical protein RF11_00197 [Thelohanellus kitauei]|uniref:Uncharacterized protein n=1 Tax=Thelohanellus kitauei TaxID=669202 RepID=A0A0C2M1Y0_THEKT|nr:hypothetical protein RF11_00197 [Thelohanellus kitauei]